MLGREVCSLDLLAREVAEPAHCGSVLEPLLALQEHDALKDGLRIALQYHALYARAGTAWFATLAIT